MRARGLFFVLLGCARANWLTELTGPLIQKAEEGLPAVSEKTNEVVHRVKEGFAAVLEKAPAVFTGMMRRVEHPPVQLPEERKSYGITTAKVQAYLQLSLISTCSWERIASGSILCNSYKAIERVYDAARDAAAYVVRDKDILVVSFRPTRSWTNWETNIDAQLVPLPHAPDGVQVHRGFLAHYQAIQSRLEELVFGSLGNRALHLTGYSLGGAIAIVSLESWVRQLKEKKLTNAVQVFAYASPRVGNARFAALVESLNFPVARYTIHNDVVSQLPPRALGYVHVGQEFYFNGTALVKCRLDHDEDPDCAYGSGALTHKGHLAPIPKHISC